MFSDYLSIAWTGDYESLKHFVSELLKIDGIWSHPGGDKKLFTSEYVTISWRKSKNVILVDGERAVDIIKELCKLICNGGEGIDSHGLHSSETADICKDIEDLKCGQSVNGEAIQSLSDSICHLSSTLSQFRDFINAGKETVPDELTVTQSTNGYAKQIHNCNAELIGNPNVLNQTNNTINICDDDLLADERPLQLQAMAEISEQTTYAKVVASQPALDSGSKIIDHLVSSGSAKKSKLNTKTSDTNQEQKSKVSDPTIHNDTDNGFIGVERKRNKIKQLFLTGIAENVKENQIQSYLVDRNIIPTRITIFQSRRKGTILAKVNIPSASFPLVQHEHFWPKFVTCKPWRPNLNGRKAEWNIRVPKVGNYSTFV